MGINKYFTQDIIIKRKVRDKINGVVKETITPISELKVAIDKAKTNYTYASDKESFVYSDVVYAPYGTDIMEDDIVSSDGKEYDVVSVIDPMNRHHHLEILCNIKE